MGDLAIITGGARRIGRATAIHLASAGYDIALHYRTSSADAEQLAGELRQSGRRCDVFQADLSQPQQAAELIHSVVAKMGTPTALINNASVFGDDRFGKIAAGQLAQHMAVHVEAPMLAAQAFSEAVQTGAIVNLIDARIARTVTDHFTYTLSKNALWTLTKMLAIQLAPRIRVNAVCPGVILPAVTGDQGQFERLAAQVPMARHGQPQDIAEAVLYLLHADFVTGQAVFLDGGEHLCRGFR